MNYSMSLSDGVGCALGWGCGDVPVGAPAFAYSYAAKSSEPTTELTISAAHPSTPSPSRTNAPIPSHFPGIALQGSLARQSFVPETKRYSDRRTFPPRYT